MEYCKIKNLADGCMWDNSKQTYLLIGGSVGDYWTCGCQFFRVLEESLSWWAFGASLSYIPDWTNRYDENNGVYPFLGGSASHGPRCGFSAFDLLYNALFTYPDIGSCLYLHTRCILV